MDDVINQFVNAARFAAQKNLRRYTRYLDPAQAVQARQTAKEFGVSFCTWGGYERAERVVGCFSPDAQNPEHSEYPIVCLCARIDSRFSHLTHRDLLGAFMALGLTRDCIGDIIIVSDHVYLFALEQTAAYIVSSMTSAGRTSLSFRVMEAMPDIPEPDGVTFSAVVSSLRLDAVLAAAYHLSRSEASELIRSGAVKVNHLPEDRVDRSLSADSLLSLKGRGRVRLLRINGATKKQRIGITLFRYD